MAAMEAIEYLQVARSRNMNLTLFLTLLCGKLRSSLGA